VRHPVDIDHFKSVNTSTAMAAGYALLSLAAELAAGVRDLDTVARTAARVVIHAPRRPHEKAHRPRGGHQKTVCGERPIASARDRLSSTVSMGVASALDLVRELGRRPCTHLGGALPGATRRGNGQGAAAPGGARRQHERDSGHAELGSEPPDMTER